MVGLAVMAELQCATLILTPSTVAARQWRTELLDKTSLRAEDIGEYTGQTKEIRPITLSTYQILVYRKRQGGEGWPTIRSTCRWRACTAGRRIAMVETSLSMFMSLALEFSVLL